MTSEERPENEVAKAEPSTAAGEENSADFSEAGRFSLAAICAISLGQLFEKKWDADFCSRSIKFILINLQLPQRVCDWIEISESCCY